MADFYFSNDNNTEIGGLNDWVCLLIETYIDALAHKEINIRNLSWILLTSPNNYLNGSIVNQTNHPCWTLS